MTMINQSGNKPALRLFLIFFTLSVLYIFSMFYRGSSAVIAPDLVRDLGLDAESLGILGGAFFYSFALLQIPMGPMLDRIGPRSVIAFFSLIGGLGALLFASGGSFITAFFGRILIGMGMACMLMGAMKVFILNFSPDRFATLVGFYYSIGTVGNVLSGSPLAYLASNFGWRRSFYFAGGITILLGFLVYWALGGEKKKESHIASSEQAIGLLSSVRLVLGSLAFWQIAVVTFFRHGTFISLQGLWLGPYLIDIKGYSPVQAGNMLVIMAIGIIVGSPVGGRLSDRTLKSPKAVSMAGFGLFLITLFLLIWVSKTRNPYWYGSLLFSMGFSAALAMMLFTHAKELFPLTISATVLAGVNFFSMAGGALVMTALGKVIEYFPRTNHTYPAEAYHFAFLICFLVMAASTIFYAFSPSKKRHSA